MQYFKLLCSIIKRCCKLHLGQTNCEGVGIQTDQPKRKRSGPPKTNKDFFVFFVLNVVVGTNRNRTTPLPGDKIIMVHMHSFQKLGKVNNLKAKWFLKSDGIAIINCCLNNPFPPALAP